VSGLFGAATGGESMTASAIEQQLTGPGGPFEVVVEEVKGVATKVYRQRLRSLREVAALAEQRGSQAFLAYKDDRFSCGEFVAMSRAVSAGLVAGPAKLRAGDRVAVLAANCAEWCITFWGTVAMGSVLVGLNGWWKADEILYGLADSGSAAAVMDRPRYERVAGQLASCPDLRAVYLIGTSPSEVASPGGSVELRSFDELLAAPASSSDPWESPIDEDAAAVIFYTSGTTGRPKGAVSTHRSMLANLQDTFFLAVFGMLSGLGETSADSTGPAPGAEQVTALLTAPLFHVSGCHSGLVVALAAGTRLVIAAGRFDPEQIMATIERERITVWTAVPTMIWRVVDHPRRHDFDLSSVQTVAYGGSPSGSELRRRVHETFPFVRSIGNAYGLTETSSVATICAGEEAADHPTSVGRPLPVVEIRIVDPDTATAEIFEAEGLGTDEVGEICVAGSILMAGYWRRDEDTAAVLENGWLRTGDLGYLDDEGRLYVTDRAKDMIIRAGENVYCVEIEDRLSQHPGVAEAAVVGVPHEELGEEVRAIVVAEPGAALSADELRAWVAATLADFKVPAYVEITSEPLPRNASGKMLKNVLRGLGEASLEETF
jgi:long-chain acyl-CoA synthetase